MAHGLSTFDPCHLGVIDDEGALPSMMASNLIVSDD